MARPERKDVDYFPHYKNHGAKMQYLKNKYGNDGYAVWYQIMERLAGAENHHINLSDDLQLVFLADYCGVSEEVLLEIIEFLVKAKWLHKKLWDDWKIICSSEFIASIKDAYIRRKNECINIEQIELMYYNNSQGSVLLDSNNTQSKVEKSKEEKSKGEKRTYLEFVKLSESEHDKLQESIGSNALSEYISDLNNYIGSKGKKYKSHYHTILAWYRRDNPTAKKSVKSKSEYFHR